MKEYRVTILDWDKRGKKEIATVIALGIAEVRRFAKYWGIPTLEYHKDLGVWQGCFYHMECIAFEVNARR